MTNCPCQSGINYETCCQPYHTGEKIAATAEVLMRSRYCAYALGAVEYLLNTTHRENPQYRKNTQAWRQELATYCRDVQCLGLSILDSAPGDTKATVTFQAKLSNKGNPFILAETSTFVKVGQRWFYHSGHSRTLAPDPPTIPINRGPAGWG